MICQFVWEINTTLSVYQYIGINKMSLYIIQHREVETFIIGFNGYFNFFSIIIELLSRWLKGIKKDLGQYFRKDLVSDQLNAVVSFWPQAKLSLLICSTMCYLSLYKSSYTGI